MPMFLNFMIGSKVKLCNEVVMLQARSPNIFPQI